MCVVFGLWGQAASAQEMVEFDRMNVRFVLPEGWERLEPFAHPKAEVHTFVSPDTTLYFEIDANEFNGLEELERWVGGRERFPLGPADSFEELRRVEHDVLDRIGARGTTFRLRTEKWEGHARFFEHRNRRMLIKVLGRRGTTAQEKAALRQMIESFRLTTRAL